MDGKNRWSEHDTDREESEKKRKYLAHKKEDREQTITEHAEGTARLARDFASAFRMGEQGWEAGALHDIGKYSEEFQKRIRDPEHTAKCDHATAGAWEACKYGQLEIAMCIAGHHSGLMNFGGKWDAEDAGTFLGRMKKGQNGTFPDSSGWQSEGTSDGLKKLPPMKQPETEQETYWRIKFLYSALVDADFLDTEAFMEEGQVKRGGGIGIRELADRLEADLQKKGWLKAGEGLNGLRTEILETAAKKGRELPGGVYTLTVPTGGGKTVSSLRFALQHAQEHGLDRVIYVIPYTNIIEQTADTFRKILGEDAVLEHHSNAEYLEDDEERWNWKKLACENWDAPVIVTTAVQFFESLFHNKSSRCRKLHRIANSVIIYDEIQMLPVKYWHPCVSVMQELTEHYQATQVFCSATQPAISFPDQRKIPEITEHTDVYFQKFKRVAFRHAGQIPLEEAAEKIREKESVLCIVNTKRTAKELFELLKDEKDVFFLTTMMVPEHRVNVLNQIRERLDGEKPKACRLIATSLVEAGVDLDFDFVMRELAGLDSILQAAGRCNRNRRRSVRDSITEVFSLEKKAHPSIRQQIDSAVYVMNQYEEWDSLEAIEAYFQFYRRLRGEENLDTKNIMEKMKRYAFEDIAKEFQMIDQETFPVYVPWGKEGEKLIEQLRRGEYHKNLLRHLGRYSVNLFQKHYQEWLRLGNIEWINGLAVLNNGKLYSEQTGMEFEAEEGAALFY